MGLFERILGNLMGGRLGGLGCSKQPLAVILKLVKRIAGPVVSA